MSARSAPAVSRSSSQARGHSPLDPSGRVLKLTLEYDGTDFVGWQRQANGVSVQGLLEAALAEFEGRPVAVHGAGRTDAGVHALGQVASVWVQSPHSTTAVRRGLNSTLPRSIRVIAVEDAAPGFHARYHATGKVYEYRIVTTPLMSPFHVRYAWHVPRPLDVEAMRDSAAALVGRHDFAAFQGSRSVIRDTTRTVESLDLQGGTESGALTVTISADGFLRHMVRNIVGTLAEAGFGRCGEVRMREILASRDRRQAGPTAPPQGLYLLRVRY